MVKPLKGKRKNISTTSRLHENRWYLSHFWREVWVHRGAYITRFAKDTDQWDTYGGKLQLSSMGHLSDLELDPTRWVAVWLRGSSAREVQQLRTSHNLMTIWYDLEGMQVNNLIHIPYIYHTYSIHIPPKIGAVLGGKFSEPREPSDHIQHCIANLTQHSCTMAWQLGSAPAAKVQPRSKTTIEDEHVNKNFTNLSWWLLQPPQTCGSWLDLGNLGSPMTWQADLGWQVPHHLT